ncbi:Protein T2, variant 2 [Schistosoma haematobium]|uniref:Protein T2, variant 2 n=3 Tax=Schistosoma haematobium TaxID=6185 RepID=A0A922LQV1_SCHHA|nr:Protein T2, variant 2 [Schistosoma haematobium]KAH9591629.1 Protein T2, variant 2 [Schistosoma haematobium]CAH8676459.1 unnamed protein product [Schistosoma haematobium]
MVEFMAEVGQELHLTVKPSTPTSGKRKSSSRLSLFHSTARKSRASAGDLNLPTPNGALTSLTDGSSSDLHDTPMRAKLEKRQHRIFEFFVTERNYVEILRYLCLSAYPQVIDENQPGGPVLPRQEADFVFGKLGAIYELHDRLQPQFNELENNWSLSESCLGNVLQLSLLTEMDRAYGNYMQFYSPPHLHHLGEQFPRFHAFMRQVEKRKESGRQSLTALLVRPVQRLPSISLLMDGIAKFTPQSHPDYNAVKEFAKGINELLAKINDRLRKNEERLSLLSLYHEISGAPPEMLSSSRSLVAKLNVFELGVSASGNTTCEPVTLFLLSDSLEVARPRKRFTGEPLAHAIRAALAAVQGEGSEHNFDGNHDQTSINNGDFSSNPSTNTALSGVSVSRTGSGASGTSVVNLGLMEGKQRCCYKHLQLLKLQEIKQVVNFDTASPDRAAFGLVVRSSSEVDDRVHAYCLAASFAASAAVVSGKCPEPVESAVAAATASGQISNAVSIDTSPSNITTNSNNSHVAMLQACVGEAKRVFLHRLCHHICLVSCIAKNPEEILVDVEPEELLGFDLEQVFNATALALSSKRITRQLTRNISIKTPRRLPASAKRQFGAQPPQPPSTPTSHRLQVPIEMDESQTTDMYLIPSPRRSMLGSFLGSSCTSLSNFLNTALRTNNNLNNINHGNSALNRAMLPPSRLAMTPKPIRRLLPRSSRQNSFDDLDLNDDDDVPFSQLGSSLLSLTSLDSLSTLDNPVNRVDVVSNRNTPNLKCRAGSAVWESASHLGFSTSDDVRHSFRSPSGSFLGGFDEGCSRKHGKKQKKPKLRAVSQMFQRSSIMVKAKESRKIGSEKIDAELNSQNSLPSSRRDSLFRGLFFRKN